MRIHYLIVYVVSSKKTYAPSQTVGDSVAVRRLTELAELAQANRLQVALYPHIWFWLERMPHALSLVRQVNRPNLGVAFNLPHYLALAKPGERDTWPTLLTDCKPHLKLMTICGATPTNETDSKKIWDYLIQPLGQGSFDTFGLVRFAVRELGYTGPIGLQSYNLKGSKLDNMRRSLAVWQTWKQKLEAQP